MHCAVTQLPYPGKWGVNSGIALFRLDRLRDTGWAIDINNIMTQVWLHQPHRDIKQYCSVYARLVLRHHAHSWRAIPDLSLFLTVLKICSGRAGCSTVISAY